MIQCNAQHVKQVPRHRTDVKDCQLLPWYEAGFVFLFIIQIALQGCDRYILDPMVPLGVVVDADNEQINGVRRQKLSESELNAVADILEAQMGQWFLNTTVISLATPSTKYHTGEAQIDNRRRVKKRAFFAPIYLTNLTDQVQVVSWDNIQFRPFHKREPHNGRVLGLTRYMSDGAQLGIPYGQPLSIAAGESVALSVSCSISGTSGGMLLRFAIADAQTGAVTSTAEFAYGSVNAFPKNIRERILKP